MNHSEAIESSAVAAYLLGDLSEAQRDAFEVHYIDCPICAEAVWAGTKMFAAGREAVKSPEPKVIPFPVRWFTARAVAAMLAVVVGIQSYVILRPPALAQVATMGPVLAGTMRAGETMATVHFEDGLPTNVGIDIPPDQPFPNYRIEVRNSSGKVLTKVNATARQVRSEQGFSIVLRPLPAGTYVVVVEGVQSDGTRVGIITPGFVVE